jgi:SAM-dependent methyltransferase
MLSINDISSTLVNKNGIWCSANLSPVFYPEMGNENTVQFEDNSFWYKHRNECIFEAIRNFPPIENTILEIGGGNGFVSSGLEKNTFSVIMLEPDSAGIQNAKNRNVKNLIHSSYEDAQLIEMSLPSIGLFDVLEHIENEIAFLSSVFGKLKTGGRLYITVPAYNFLFSEEDVHDKHFRRYTLKELKYKLEASGFDVEYSTYFFSLLPLPIFLLRTLPTLLGFKRKDSVDFYAQEHKGFSGVYEKALDFIWNKEKGVLKRKKKVLFGGSILVVAKKT